MADEIAKKIKLYSPFMDLHRVIIFYYKLAWFYFGQRQFSEALDYLNQILNMKSKFLREDIECYVKLLQVCSHMELDHRQLTLSLLSSTERVFRKTNQGGAIIQSAFQLIKVSLLQPDKLSHQRSQFLKSIQKLSQSRLEQHQVVYFNFKAWAQTLLTNTAIEKIIRNEYLES